MFIPVRCSVLSKRLSFRRRRVQRSGEPGVVSHYSGCDEPAIEAQVLVGKKRRRKLRQRDRFLRRLLKGAHNRFSKRRLCVSAQIHEAAVIATYFAKGWYVR